MIGRYVFSIVVGSMITLSLLFVMHLLIEHAEDALSALKMIERSFNGGPWHRVFPDDGIPDMPRETFSIAVDDLEPGSHVVLVRATDHAGNIGTGRLRFETR